MMMILGRTVLTLMAHSGLFRLLNAKAFKFILIKKGSLKKIAVSDVTVAALWTIGRPDKGCRETLAALGRSSSRSFSLKIIFVPTFSYGNLLTEIIKLHVLIKLTHL